MTISADGNVQALVFLHIPKTAGSTLHSIFNRRYRGVYNVFASSHDDAEVVRLKNLSEAKRRKIRLLKGHMPFGLHRYLPVEARYFTMLRDPVERVVSQYFYIHKNKNNPLHDTLVSNEMSPGDLVSSGVSPGLNNGQIRWLIGGVTDVEFNGIEDGHLEQALDNIDRFFVLVGINELFDQSILLLSKRLGWKRLPYYDRENTNRRKAVVSDSDLDLIREFNAFDIRLYEIMRKRLDEAIASIPDFDQLLEDFRSRNRLYTLFKQPLRTLGIAR